MKKKIPTFKNDREADEFVARADLGNYDLSGAELLRFALKPNDESINLRLSQRLPAALGRLKPRHP